MPCGREHGRVKALAIPSASWNAPAQASCPEGDRGPVHRDGKPRRTTMAPSVPRRCVNIRAGGAGGRRPPISRLGLVWFAGEESRRGHGCSQLGGDLDDSSVATSTRLTCGRLTGEDSPRSMHPTLAAPFRPRRHRRAPKPM